MSINLVFMQIPLVGEISGALQGQPEAQQAYAQEHAKEIQQREQEQIQKTEKQDASKSVDPDGRQGAAQDHPRRQARKRRQEPEQELVEERPLGTKDNPWAGHLLNKRV